MQTLLLKVKNTLENRAIVYFYGNEIEDCLSHNVLLFGRQLHQTNNYSDLTEYTDWKKSSKLKENSKTFLDLMETWVLDFNKGQTQMWWWY